MICAKAGITDGHSPMLGCMHCDKHVHTLCLMMSHESSSGIKQRNTITWVHEFIVSQHLHYLCSSCTSATLIGSFLQSLQVTFGDRLNKLRDKLAEIGKRVKYKM